MKCPACGHALEEMTIDTIGIDVCRGGCGGVWFDNFELSKVDEQHESAGERLVEIERDDSTLVDHAGGRRCPRCDDQVLMRHFFSVKKEVEVDECPSCAGVWLDPGELLTIRSQYATEGERRQAARDYFDEIFGTQLEAMRAESQARAESAARFARMFKFICPSYWVPGKQTWGAF